jgi:acylphosphatase
MGLPTDHDPYRKPGNYEENFEVGDFEDFIKPLVETLDLYHSRGIDPRAFAIAFNQLVENHPDGVIEIVAMERRGSDLDKFLVRVKTAPGVNRSQLHAEYFSEYNRLNALSARNLVLELAQSDLQIGMLTGMVTNLIERSDVEVSQTYRLGKRVVLNIVDGSFERGFSVILQIGEDGALPSVEIPGRLPASSEIQKSYEKWRFLLGDLQTRRSEISDVHVETETTNTEEPGEALRLEAPKVQIINVSITENIRDVASQLEESINQWLNSDLFQPIRETLLEKLNPADEIRVLIQTDDTQLRRLPWHVWNWFRNYRKAEIALSSTTYGEANRLASTRTKIRILAILGDRQGINVNADRQLLEQLSNDMEIVFLDEPTREQLDKMLWDEQGWDILFFAGHSNSQLLTWQ